MPANRYYTPQELSENSTVQLDPDESLHLKTVMRNIEGDLVELVNGRGFLAHAQVASIQKKQVTLKINRIEIFPKDTRLEVGIGYLVQDKVDWLLEKCCELKATDIVLIKTQNVAKGSFTDGQKERMQRVLIAALKQSGRVWLPQIQLIDSLETFINCADTIYYGDINKSCPPMLDIFDPSKPFKLLVGPAKGFSENELKKLRHKENCIGVFLGDTILRAETAAILMTGLATHALMMRSHHF
jgi:16S rRNA (uracil1498-N3)-methyltransferase